jgi:hypothetical protein
MEEVGHTPSYWEIGRVNTRHTPSYWETGTVNTMLDHNDWEGEIGEVKCFSNFLKRITLSSQTHGL